MAKMLTKDPLYRITPEYALAHPYFVKTRHASQQETVQNSNETPETAVET